MQSLSEVLCTYPNIIDTMNSACVLAGDEILDEYEKKDLEIDYKVDNSPLTRADKRAQDVIIEILGKNFGDIPIVSEEDKHITTFLKSRPFFLVDPLDGTKEFIKKNDQFTVNIALICEKKSELGSVYAPAQGALYFRDQDLSSYHLKSAKTELKGKTKKCIKCRTQPKSGPVIITSASHSSMQTLGYCELYNSPKTISAGSSLKFCRIAEGKCDIYPRLGRTMEWDTAAGHAVLKGAGGNVFKLNCLKELLYGKENLENPYFVASKHGTSLYSSNLSC